MINDIAPEQLLDALSTGYFPMAKGRHETELYWFNPEMRGILPINGLHVPKRLRSFMRTTSFEVRFNTAFNAVMHACADTHRPTEDDTWINDEIITLYTELHEMGYAHSVECYEDNTLVGGIYGVALGGAFMGESMFSKRSNASKMALVTLIEHLNKQGFELFDTQFINDHLQQFGVYEMPRGTYLTHLRELIYKDVSFNTQSAN